MQTSRSRSAVRVTPALLAALTVLALTVLLLGPVTAARAAAGGSTLTAGERLAAGQQLSSPDGRYRAVMQADGNLVVYAPDGRALFASNTYARGSRLDVQPDGNVVVYAPDGAARWNSGTWTSPGSRLTLQDDGNLVLYRPDGRAAWWSGWDAPDRLRPGQVLLAGQQLTSPDRRYRAAMQPDGNLVVYGPGDRVIAATYTFGTGNWLAMQADGNLVVYAPGSRPLWHARSWGADGGAVLQDDGNLVVRRADGRAVWWSGWDTPDRLRPGQQLAAGQQLTSPGGRARAVMQADGNLVVYGAGDRVFSATGTFAARSRLAMQTDGNLVVYAPDGRAVWDSRTWGADGGVALQDDGNLVFRRGDGSPAGAWPFPMAVSPGDSTQVVTVAAPSAGSTTGRLAAWELTPVGWTRVLGPVTAWLGSSGIGVASEGSTRTPAGTYTLTEAFGRSGNPGTALPYRVIDQHDWWVSDVASPLYNRHTRCAPGTCSFRESAGENLWQQGWVYDLAVVLDHNRQGTPGAGSAFFLHVTNGAPTAGCVAIARDDLAALMRWLRPTARPLVSIGVG
ncbi:L,D-transpeptidase family protein [Modestobacter sp. SSW1-42]|uniref:L,D-transpeptidase family protein n=1 Tax=Modestobacter sp. SSW1-42 TaxID=596372 RepID=UPI003987D1CB